MKSEWAIGFFVLRVLSVLLIKRAAGNSGHCAKLTSCSCEYEDGAVVDLWPLALSNGTARFSRLRDPKQDFFSWNPCLSFNEGDCISVAVCQVEPSVPHPQFWSLGSQESATFTTNDQGQLILVYSETQFNTLRTSYVTLICDVNAAGSTVEAVGERPEGANFDFTLRSKYACAVGGSTGLSAGTIILIGLVSLVTIYFLVGIPFQIFIRNQTGASVVPFSSFWKNIATLVKDGFLFTFTCKRGNGYDHV